MRVVHPGALVGWEIKVSTCFINKWNRNCWVHSILKGSLSARKWHSYFVMHMWIRCVMSRDAKCISGVSVNDTVWAETPSMRLCPWSCPVFPISPKDSDKKHQLLQPKSSIASERDRGRIWNSIVLQWDEMNKMKFNRNKNKITGLD